MIRKALDKQWFAWRPHVRTPFVLSGSSLIAGGVAGVLAHTLHLQYHPSNAFEVLPYVTKSEPMHALLFAAVFLVSFGLPAVLFRSPAKLGILGLAGVVLLYFGLVFGEWLHCVLEIGIYPAMAHVAPNDLIPTVNRMYEARSPFAYLEFVGGWLLLLGALILGLWMLIQRPFPRWTAALLLATDLGALLAYTPWTHWIIGGRWPVVFYLGMAAIGYSLITRAGEGTPVRAMPLLGPKVKLL